MAVIGSLFGGKKIPENSLGQELLLLCLQNLASIGEGQNQQTDQQIVLFKKMLASNTSANELKKQIAIIVETLNKSLIKSMDKAQLKEILDPLCNMLSQIITPEQDNNLQAIQQLAKNIQDLDTLGDFIEELSQIIFNSTLSKTEGFETFLTQLNERIDVIKQCLFSNSETSLAITECSKTLTQSVISQVNHIQSSFSKTDNIEDLEKTICKNIDLIISEVSRFEKQRKVLDKTAANTITKLNQELTQTRYESDYLKEDLIKQRNHAHTDPLTNLPNRYAYAERLQLEYDRWSRYKKPLSLIICDLDLFKKINDTYGHLAGDQALKESAQILKKAIRDTDFIARYGGDEFIFLMPETGLTEATKAINKIRTTIQDEIVHGGTFTFRLSMSFGVASFNDDDTCTSVFARADEALYRAKSKGRNLVCTQRKNS